MSKDKKSKPRHDDNIQQVCSICGENFMETPYALLSRTIMKPDSKPKCDSCLEKQKGPAK